MKRFNHTSLVTHTPVSPQTKQPKKRQITQAWVRSQSIVTDLASTVPSFVCPECKTRFILTYGRFGRFDHFRDSAFHCIDCSGANGFIKAD